MSNDLVSRKNFVLLGLSLAGGGLLTTGCGDDPAPSKDGDTGGGAGTSPAGGSAGTAGGSSGGSSSAGSSGAGTSGGTTSTGGTSGGTTSSGGTSSGGTDAGGSAGSAQGGSAGSDGGSAGSGGGSGGSGSVACAAVIIEISCNHEHELTIPVEDVMAGTQKNYMLSNNGTHSHPITLTAAHFATLQAGGTVHIYASSSVQPHCVTITCGVATQPTPAECAADSMSC
jgi:hypothetical protein